MLDKIIIDKFKLLEILKSNREKHSQKYEIAYTNWVEAYGMLLKELEKRLLRGNPVPFNYVKLDKPKSFLSCYDEAIRMLDLTNQEEIELDNEEFKNLVMDKWSWTEHFSSSSASYSSSSSSSSHVDSILKEIDQQYKTEEN